MQIPLRALLSVLALLTGSTTAFGQESQTPRDLVLPGDMRVCDARAYLADQDIGGVAVRKGPSTSAPLITMLPAMRMKPAGKGLELFGADVTVVGTDRKGWFLIEDADYDAADDAGGPARKVQTWRDTGLVYKGRGWVHGSRLRVEIVSSRGMRASFAADAPITIKIDRPGYGPEIESTYLDCAGVAVRLRAKYEGKTIEGWINPKIETEKLCASQRTNCN